MNNVADKIVINENRKTEMLQRAPTVTCDLIVMVQQVANIFTGMANIN